MLPFPQIDPVIFRLGPLAFRWYGLMYLLGFAGGYLILKNRYPKAAPGVTPRHVENLVLMAGLGLIVGARLGEVLFYQWTNWSDYLANPLEIIALWHGGMSFHGGLIGAIISGVAYLKWAKLPIIPASDAAFLAVPIGLGLGRLANFINGELYGRVTNLPWAMVFPDGGPLPRHPSQLYEALLEGPLLFGLLWYFRDRLKPGGLTALFILGYSALRFLVELVREPDANLGFILAFLTTGQLLCLAQAAGGLLFWRWVNRRAG
jgi:phosphatidylglycerol:prolipoprotein diacylglycerol transferase